MYSLDTTTEENLPEKIKHKKRRCCDPEEQLEWAIKERDFCLSQKKPKITCNMHVEKGHKVVKEYNKNVELRNMCSLSPTIDQKG